MLFTITVKEGENPWLDLFYIWNISLAGVSHCLTEALIRSLKIPGRWKKRKKTQVVYLIQGKEMK
jgi:hypothetical protein